MASFDLREVYLPVPVHPASRHFLRFLLRDTVYQFKALCFGLSTAPQVFTWVMAPVSTILHSLGIRMRRYLDDWLVQSSSQESLLGGLPTVLRLCHDLGILIRPRQSNLIPSKIVQYLWVVIGSTSFRLLRRWNASHGCDPQPPSFCHAPRLPRACGCRF